MVSYVISKLVKSSPFRYFNFIFKFNLVSVLVNGISNKSCAQKKKKKVDEMKDLAKLQTSPLGTCTMATIPCGNSTDKEVSTLLRVDSFFITSW